MRSGTACDAGRKQAGLATILMVLFVGMAVMVAATGLMYGLYNSQEKQLTVNAVTLAQQRAWNTVELVRLYLGKISCSTLPANGVELYNSEGIARATVSYLPSSQLAGSCMIGVDITGYAASGTPSAATSTINAIYELTSSSGFKTYKVGLAFNKDITYSGGSFQIVNGDYMSNFTITGSLTVSSGTTIKASGCAEGNIYLSGGGVANDTVLLSESDITATSMSQPNNLSLWGRNIDISQSGGSYSYIKAGAFNVNVVSSGSTIGTAISGGVPKNGMIIPNDSSAATITLTDGSVFVIDFTDTQNISVDSSSGLITVNSDDAISQESGSGSLPDTFSFVDNSVYGGTLNFMNGTVTTLWGNQVTLGGWSGNYTTLYANSVAKMNSATIGTLQGGSDLYVRANGNLPKINNASKIAGSIINSDNNNVVYNGSIKNLTTGVSGFSPGLPGVPVCDSDASPITVDAESYRESANYIFYFDDSSGDPMLKVQNVKLSSGDTAVSGTYNLKTDDVRTLSGLDFMQCGWYDSYCLRDASQANGWTLSGIYRFPPGILFFEGNITVSGVSNSSTLYNSIVSTGNITLTSSGHGPLVAPNFADPATLCNASFYPSNICKKSSDGSVAFVTWTDSSGISHTGFPLANIAILTDKDFSVSGWTISGSVVLGGGISTNGALVTIYGGLSVGGNTASTATISAGGIKVDVSGLTEDQTYIASGDSSTGGSGSGQSTATVKWSRYQ